MLMNEMLYLNECFNPVLLFFYMFRTYYVHHQEDHTVHVALYDMLFMAKLQYSTIIYLDVLYSSLL